MHMKDGWRVAEPVLAAQPVESPTLSEAAAVALARDEDLENLRFVDGELTGFSGKTLDVRGCVFEHCRFGDNDFKRISFVDCVFDKCEWSNAAYERGVSAGTPAGLPHDGSGNHAGRADERGL